MYTYSSLYIVIHTLSICWVQMMNEEYEEALALAQQYGLDCDLVYQTQWHSYPVTMETIEAYLVCYSNFVMLSYQSSEVRAYGTCTCSLYSQSF